MPHILSTQGIGLGLSQCKGVFEPKVDLLLTWVRVWNNSNGVVGYILRSARVYIYICIHIYIYM